MVISFLIAVYFQFVHESLGLAPLDPSLALVLSVAITTVAWLGVTFLTPPADDATLQGFYDAIRPVGKGWTRFRESGAGGAGAHESLTPAFLGWFLGCTAVYSALFGTGYLLYGQFLPGVVCLLLFAAATAGMFKLLRLAY